MLLIDKVHHSFLLQCQRSREKEKELVRRRLFLFIAAVETTLTNQTFSTGIGRYETRKLLKRFQITSH
jgi:hypothetical protein